MVSNLNRFRRMVLDCEEVPTFAELSFSWKREGEEDSGYEVLIILCSHGCHRLRSVIISHTLLCHAINAARILHHSVNSSYANGVRTLCMQEKPLPIHNQHRSPEWTDTSCSQLTTTSAGRTHSHLSHKHLVTCHITTTNYQIIASPTRTLLHRTDLPTTLHQSSPCLRSNSHPPS